MKRIILSILAVAALASCSKTESAYVEQDQEIKLAPVAALSTKADYKGAINDVYYPKAEEFGVWAYWLDQDPGKTFVDATTYLGANGAVEFTNKGAYWGGTTTYYWPKNGSLRFAAYSPYVLPAGEVKHSLTSASEDVYTLTGYIQPTTTDATVDLLFAPTSVSYNAETAAEKVSVVFEHALSWITLKVKSTAAAAGAFNIQKVEINDVVYTGDLVASMLEDDVTKKFAWELGTDKAAYEVYEGAYTVNTNPAVIDAVANGTVVLPQEPTTVTVYYTQNAMEGTPELEDQKVTVPLTLSAAAVEQNEENANWIPGRHYTYTLTFDLDEILINPTVEDWKDVDAGEIEADNAVTVSTAAELKAALTNGGTVVLKNDITVEEEVTTTLNTVLDLNGKVLKLTTSDRGITAKSNGLTIKNGKIESTNYKAAILAYGNSDSENPYEVAVVLQDVELTSNAAYSGAVVAFNAQDGASLPYNTESLAPTKLTINGGSITNTCAEAIYAVKSFGFCDVAIANADITGAYGAVSVERSDLAMTNSTLTGGTYDLHLFASDVKYSDDCTLDTKKFYIQIKSELEGGDSFDCYVNGVLYSVAASELAAAVKNGGDVTVSESVVVYEGLKSTANCNITIAENAVLTASQTVYVPSEVSALICSKGGVTTIESEGKVDGSGSDDYAVEVRGGDMVIKSGHYVGSVSAVYASEGTITIEGGTFEVASSSYGTTYLLNLADANGKNGKAKIIVKGGSFVGFNPADNKAENPTVNFVAEGYKVVQEGNVYTVVAE